MWFWVLCRLLVTAGVVAGVAEGIGHRKGGQHGTEELVVHHLEIVGLIRQAIDPERGGQRNHPRLRADQPVNAIGMIGADTAEPVGVVGDFERAGDVGQHRDYFGGGQGGDIDMNIQRWGSQFEDAGEAQKSSSQVNGMNVTRVEIAGTYLAPGGPMMESQGKKENHRLLGAIVEGPEGTVFFKFTGPAKTIDAAKGEFDAMLGSIAK